MRLRTLMIFSTLTFAPLVMAQAQEVNTDTVRAGRYDSGKMWTFEYAPRQYFSQTYNFNADEQWFERARVSALRIPGCSASFVSPNGLIVTNHHCARDGVFAVSKPGENLLENGFFATTLDGERRVPGMYADQLIAIQDVSREIFDAVDAVPEAQRAAARAAASRDIVSALKTRYSSAGDSILVQVVPLYAGGRYSAYVFRRYTDVRLVGAAELQIGFFGGDADNFTYPRYALDFSFLRVYGKDGQPIGSPNYFRWSRKGVQENDVVFVIGNPGPTTRMNAVAQLEFIRDVQIPAQLRALQSRWDALNVAYQANPHGPEGPELRNKMFDFSNSLKAAGGRIAALNDAVIMARRRDAERQFVAAVQRDTALTRKYGDVLTRLADVQQRKRQHAALYAAALYYNTGLATPALLRRAVVANEYVAARQAGAQPDSLARIASRLLQISNEGPSVEKALVIGQVDQWMAFLPDADSLLNVIGARSAAEAVQALAASAYADSARIAAALAANSLPTDDPAFRAARAFGAITAATVADYRRLTEEEAELNSLLGRARFEIYGTELAPDATSSPRITDGVVKPYEYNGTIAPVYTTFYGMYDRFSAFGPGSEWELPKRWVPKPKDLDLGTPLNFISTADTYGGNSGSPAVTRDLEIVGLNFDRNINGLSRDYVYLPERGRNVMVDVRAIAEALDAVYDAHRILLELNSGLLYRTEAEADRSR